ncbi:MAG: hypothetical protein IID51_10185 [Proteobacteria bacterium]|nr:hypothetical protein [Pseudomonadota bacterium]
MFPTVDGTSALKSSMAESAYFTLFGVMKGALVFRGCSHDIQKTIHSRPLGFDHEDTKKKNKGIGKKIFVPWWWISDFSSAAP